MGLNKRFKKMGAFFLGGAPALIYEQDKQSKANNAEYAAMTAEQKNAADIATEQTRLDDLAAQSGMNPASLINIKSFKDNPAGMTAATIRAETANTIATFDPLEKRLFDSTSYNDPSLANNEISAAIGSGSMTRGEFMKLSGGAGYVQGALDNAYEEQQRNFQRYGMSPTARQQEAIDNNDANKRSLAVVDAANRIRGNIKSRDEQVLMGKATAAVVPTVR